jgi:hypothetical protein
MADPRQLLAPLIEPPLPLASPVPVLPSATAWPAVFVVGAVLLAALAMVAAWLLWRRGAPRRAVRRIARMDNPVQAAHALAALVREQGLPATGAWREALDRVRFGAPEAGHTKTMARLCTEALTLLTPG